MRLDDIGRSRPRPRLGPAAMLAAGLVAVLGLFLAGSAGAAFPGTNGKIAFTGQPSGQGHGIYTLNADGSGLKELTPLENSDAHDPAWSPSGTKLAFEADAGGSYVSGPGIYVMNADGTGLKLLTKAPNSHEPAWSPDGKKLALTSNGHLSVIGADGSGLRQLENDGSDRDPAWSPNGQKIAYVASPNGSSSPQLFVVPAAGGVRTDLTPGSSLIFSQPAWSPDGSKLVVAGSTGGSDFDLYTLNADGSGLTDLTQDSAKHDAGAAWSPDGQRIVYYADVRPNSTDPGLYVVAASGGAAKRIPLPGSVRLDPAYTRLDWQVQPSANLAVTARVSKATAKPKASVAFTITVQNNGPSEAINAKLVASLTPGSSLVKATSSVKCSRSRGRITCNLGPLAPHAKAVLKLSAHAPAKGSLEAQAKASSAINDPNPANNTATARVAVK